MPYSKEKDQIIRHETSRFLDALGRFDEAQNHPFWRNVATPWGGVNTYPEIPADLHLSLLARYLSDRGLGEATLLQVPFVGAGATAHTWLQLEDWSIDIFANVIDPSYDLVMIGWNSSVHSKLTEVNQSERIDFGTSTIPHTFSQPLVIDGVQNFCRVYAIILSLIK